MALQCWQIDSDGSPPGCLIIGSTGQEVIHVYGRTSHQGNEFTIRVPSSAELIPFSRGRCRCSHFVLYDFTHSSLRQAQTFSMHPPRGSCRESLGVATFLGSRKRQLTTDYLQIASSICCSADLLFSCSAHRVEPAWMCVNRCHVWLKVWCDLKIASTHTTLGTPHARVLPPAVNHLLMVAEPW